MPSSPYPLNPGLSYNPGLLPLGNPFTNPQNYDFSRVGGPPRQASAPGGITLPVVGGGMPGQNVLGQSFGSTQPVLPTFGGIGGPAGGGAPGGGGFDLSDGIGWDDVGGAAGSVWDWVKEHPDLLIGAAGLYQTYQGQRAANKLTDQAINAAEQSYADRAPLRAVGLAGLADVMGTRAPSGVGIDATNPYATSLTPTTPTTPTAPAGPTPEAPRRRVPTATPGGGGGVGGAPLPTPPRTRLRAVGRAAL